MCRGGRSPRPGAPLPSAPAAPHLGAGQVPGPPAAAGSFPPASPRSPSRPPHAAAAGRGRLGPRRTQSRGAGTGLRAAVPRRESPERGRQPPFPTGRRRGAGGLPPPSPRVPQAPRRPGGGTHTVPSGMVRPGAGVARYSVLQPCPVPVAVPGSPRDQPQRPRGKPAGTAPGSAWPTAGRAARRGGQPGQPGGEGGAGEGGGRDEPRGCAGGRGDGRAGRRMPRRGGPVPLHPRGN